MRRAVTALVWFVLVPGLAAQEVVDRIVARIEDSIITLSEVRELGSFQQLVDGRTGNDAELLNRLVDQWIVASEAVAAQFPRPSEAAVSREVARLEKQIASAEAYRARLRELGLSPSALRRLVERQLYLADYLDYKFRPAAQVDSAQIEQYYRAQLVPQLVARDEAAPPLERVQEQIRELLTQRDINERAARWLAEARSRTKVELKPGGKAP